MAHEERPRPEPTYFADPAIDRVMGVVMALAAEVWVLRDRNRALEKLLEASGTLVPGALDGYRPAPEEEALVAKDRESFVQGLMDHLLGHQVSKGPL